jgi:peptide deformylase
MSEVLTIDTTSGIVLEQRLDPLPLFSDKHPMLSVPIPEYKEAIPNPTIKNLVTRLKMTMKLYGGVGLAANQCGVFERVFVIGTDQFQISCINPRILRSSAEMNKSDEGCLTFPGLYVKLDRPEWVEVEFTDDTGKLVQMRLEGLTARCFQHELDHMNGIRFIDNIKPIALQMARKKQQKIMKQAIRNQKKK